MDTTSPPPQLPPAKKLFLALLLTCTLGFSLFFIAGYSTANYVAQQETSHPPSPLSPSPTPQQGHMPSTIETFTPGAHYFNDTLVAITAQPPQQAVLITLSRNQQTDSYLQNTRVSYFDGQNWDRKIQATRSANGEITPDQLLINWQYQIDPSRVLKESLSAEFRFNNTTISLPDLQLQNEMVTRSMPGYTKLISSTQGTIFIDDHPLPAHIMFSKIYSLNAADIQFYDQPLSLTTDWIAFWDEQGNFYHFDITEVDRPTPIYQSHQIALKSNPLKTIVKSFTPHVTKDNHQPPQSYIVSLNHPDAPETINLTRLNSFNKSPDGQQQLYLGIGQGTVNQPDGSQISGIGLLEYIYEP